MDEVKYPNITVKLVGEDGNGFTILGKVNRALCENGASQEERDQFLREATAGSYDDLLLTCMQWVDVE